MSIDKLWDCWVRYSKGKKWTAELYAFWLNLEMNLFCLSRELSAGTYVHGSYRQFVVTDNKRREIFVASVRDRIVHRLIYDYLVGIFNKTFFYDVWSCRECKGVCGALDRCTVFLDSYPDAYVWRCDIKKFFDSVDKNYLLSLLSRRISDQHVLRLCQTIIMSYRPNEKGMPIGNLTSQVFANIYLHELDRIILHKVKPIRYLRYADDILLLFYSETEAIAARSYVIDCIRKRLLLEINEKSDIIIKARHGVKFLGFVHFPSGRKLNRRNIKRIHNRLSVLNAASYRGLVKRTSKRQRCFFEWQCFEKIIR